jgi:hypothetical protein
LLPLIIVPKEKAQSAATAAGNSFICVVLRWVCCRAKILGPGFGYPCRGQAKDLGAISDAVLVSR